MSAPEEGPGVASPIPIPSVAVPQRSPTPGDGDSRTPPSGLPPASPALGTPRSGRRPADPSRRSMDGGGRRSMEGGRRGQRHTVAVPEGAVPREGLVVSRQEKFGFIKCTSSEGRYFFHVNDCDGGAQYGSSVSFVVAHDLTTGKDVAYRVKTTAPPAHSGAASPRNSAAAASRASTPDGTGGGEGLAAAGAGAPLTPQASSGAAASEGPEGFSSAGPAAGPSQQGQSLAGRPAGQQQGPQQRRLAGQGPQGHQGQGASEHFGHHRHPSPATQRDWRLPAREANAAPLQEPQQGSAHGGRRGSGGAAASGAVSDSSTGSAAAALAPLPAPACYRGTVAQVARTGRQQGADDGLLLYIDEAGAQQRVRYGASRLAEGCPRLEPGDAVEFELAAAAPAAVGGGYQHHPAAPHPHRAVALNVRLLARGMAHSPSLDAVAAAAETGDIARGRQLGRVALLKKEFGFIRQVERPGDMFFHFSQLEGWTPEELKVGDDVEYTVRSDRDGKLSAVAVRRAPPGLVVFESVGTEVLRGVVLERPVASKQYVGTSGVLEYEVAAGADSGGAPAPAAFPLPGLPPGKARLPFAQQDVRQGSGSLRPGDHVTFRVATNLQAARAAALASVPGAAAYAGKRAVEVTLARYSGTVVMVKRERQFGFIEIESQLLEPAGSAAAASAAPATSSAPAASAAPAGSAAVAEEGSAPPAAPAPGEGAAGVAAAAAAAEEGGASQASEGSATRGAAAKVGEEGGEGAAAPLVPAPELPSKRLFFHFKEVSGQHILKPGDEVAFVLHSNLKSGELNAQRVRRTKEGPEPPPEPEPAPSPSPQPPVNPHRKLYSGNLAAGGYRQPKIARMPDGTRGFEFPRPHAVLPPLPGLEKKPEAEGEGAAAAAPGTEGGAAVPPAVLAASAAAAAAMRGAPPSNALPVGQGTTPFSSLAGVVSGEATAVEQGMARLRLAAHLSAEAPAFVPRSLSSASLDTQGAEPGRQ